MRKVFAKILRDDYLNKSENLILLGDISVGLFLDNNDQLVPNAYNMGILEQSMISFAAGLSLKSDNVFVHTISPFIIERAYEQIKLDVGYNRNKVILVSANGPFEYSKLGPTHHCSSDVPLLSLIPGIDIYLPGREAEVRESLNRISKGKNAAYLRLNNRPASTDIQPNKIIHRSRILNIFVGETVNLISNAAEDSVLYLYNIDDFVGYDLTIFDEITIYEPYSSPILGSRLKGEFKEKVVNLRYYPKTIETGIFKEIKFIEN